MTKWGYIPSLFYILFPTLKTLINAATTEIIHPNKRLTCMLWPGNSLNIKATNEAPIVCPIKRAVPHIPLAPPLRLDGAEPIIVLLLGV